MNKKATWMAVFAAMGFLVAIIITFTSLNTPLNEDGTEIYEPLGTTQLELYQTYQTGEACLNYFDMVVYNSASKSITEEDFNTYFKEYLDGFNIYCNSDYEDTDFTIKHSINNYYITYQVETPIPLIFTRENYEFKLPVYSETTVPYYGSLV
jgi:hypothetical protein